MQLLRQDMPDIVGGVVDPFFRVRRHLQPAWLMMMPETTRVDFVAALGGQEIEDGDTKHGRGGDQNVALLAGMFTKRGSESGEIHAVAGDAAPQPRRFVFGGEQAETADDLARAETA